jgi:hypothetical protein
VIVGFFKFVSLIEKSRIEDKGNFFAQQPSYMPVSQLGRITFGFAGDRFDTQFINFAVGNRRKYHFISQIRKESKPERVVLVHIQHSRNTNLAPGGVVR